MMRWLVKTTTETTSAEAPRLQAELNALQESGWAIVWVIQVSSTRYRILAQKELLT